MFRGLKWIAWGLMIGASTHAHQTVQTDACGKGLSRIADNTGAPFFHQPLVLDSEVVEALKAVVPKIDLQRIDELAENVPTIRVPADLSARVEKNYDLGRGEVLKRNRHRMDQIYSLLRAVPLEEEQRLHITERVAAEMFVDPGPRESLVFDRIGRGVESRAHESAQKPVGKEEILGQVRQIFEHWRDHENADDSHSHYSLSRLAHTLLPNAKYNQEYKQLHFLRGVATVALEQLGVAQDIRPHLDRLVNRLSEQMKRILEQEYPGMDGMMRFAEEFRGGRPFNAWVQMRRFVDREFLNGIGWKTLSYDITTDSVVELRRRYREEKDEFIDRYYGRAGRDRFRSEVISNRQGGASVVILNFLPPEAYALLGWKKSVEIPHKLLENGRVKAIYKGEAGRLRARKELLEKELRSSDRNFPLDPYFRTESQRKRVHTMELALSSQLVSNISKEARAEAGWQEKSTFELPPVDVLLRDYANVEGQIRLAAEAKTGYRQILRKVKQNYGEEVRKQMNWRYIYGSPENVQDLFDKVFLPTGEARPEFKNPEGYVRFIFMHRNGVDHATYMDSLAVYSPEQRQAVNWHGKVHAYWRVSELEQAKKFMDGPLSPESIERDISRLPKEKRSGTTRALNAMQNMLGRLYDDKGRPRRIFEGQEGLERYAGLYFRGAETEIWQLVKALFGKDRLDSHGWVFRPEKERKRADHLKANLYRDGFLPLTTRDGAMDPFYKGAKGLWLYMLANPRHKSSTQAKDFAKQVLSPSEYKELGWDNVEHRFLPKPILNEIPWKSWSKAQRDAVDRYLSVMIDKGFPAEQDWESSIGFSRDQFLGSGEFSPEGKRRSEAVFGSFEQAMESLEAASQYYGLKFLKP